MLFGNPVIQDTELVSQPLSLLKNMEFRMYYNSDDCDCAHGKPTLHEEECYYRPKHLRNQDNYVKAVEGLKKDIDTA